MQGLLAAAFDLLTAQPRLQQGVVDQWGEIGDLGRVERGRHAGHRIALSAIAGPVADQRPDGIACANADGAGVAHREPGVRVPVAVLVDRIAHLRQGPKERVAELR